VEKLEEVIEKRRGATEKEAEEEEEQRQEELEQQQLGQEEEEERVERGQDEEEERAERGQDDEEEEEEEEVATGVETSSLPTTNMTEKPASLMRKGGGDWLDDTFLKHQKCHGGYAASFALGLLTASLIIGAAALVR
jgi:alpha-D-ribose 1-methylphosphonate 5-triphosphate diphosphatase PhnM